MKSIFLIHCTKNTISNALAQVKSLTAIDQIRNGQHYTLAILLNEVNSTLSELNSIKTIWPHKLHLIYNVQNMNSAEARNILIREGLKHCNEWLHLLDPATPRENLQIREIEDMFRRYNSTAVVAGVEQVHDQDKVPQPSTRGAKTWLSLAWYTSFIRNPEAFSCEEPHVDVTLPTSGPIEVSAITSGHLSLRGLALHQVGLFDERLSILSYQNTDLCLRLLIKNFNSMIYHVASPELMEKEDCHIAQHELGLKTSCNTTYVEKTRCASILAAKYVEQWPVCLAHKIFKEQSSTPLKPILTTQNNIYAAMSGMKAAQLQLQMSKLTPFSSKSHIERIHHD